MMALFFVVSKCHRRRRRRHPPIQCIPRSHQCKAMIRPLMLTRLSKWAWNAFKTLTLFKISPRNEFKSIEVGKLKVDYLLDTFCIIIISQYIGFEQKSSLQTPTIRASEFRAVMLFSWQICSWSPPTTFNGNQLFPFNYNTPGDICALQRVPGSRRHKFRTDTIYIRTYLSCGLMVAANPLCSFVIKDA